LKSLDVGWGYTADGGRTFPLRGTGRGLMPTLDEVLARFPEGRFLVNQKHRSDRTAEAVARVLQRYPPATRARIAFWGESWDALAAAAPGVGPHFLPRAGLKRCGLAYLGSLGFGALPEPCRGKALSLPAWGLPYVWGWPDRFLAKVAAAGARAYVVEVDDPADALRLAALPIHGIMTDRIELVGPALAGRGGDAP
jgi:glycerophosphoryl diester phosphodiesterase